MTEEISALREYKDAVLREFVSVHQDIDRIGNKIDSLKDNDVSDMKVEIAMLKIKAGIWGLMGGLIPVLVGLGIQLLVRR